RTAGRPVRLRTLRYAPLPYRPLDPTEPPRRTGRVLRAALLVLLASCGAGGAAVRAPRGPQEARIASDRAARVFVLEPGGHMVEAGSLRPGAAAVVQVPPEAREPWPVVLLAVDGRSLAFEGVEPGR